MSSTRRLGKVKPSSSRLLLLCALALELSACGGSHQTSEPPPDGSGGQLGAGGQGGHAGTDAMGAAGTGGAIADAAGTGAVSDAGDAAGTGGHGGTAGAGGLDGAASAKDADQPDAALDSATPTPDAPRDQHVQLDVSLDRGNRPDACAGGVGDVCCTISDFSCGGYVCACASGLECQDDDGNRSTSGTCN